MSIDKNYALKTAISFAEKIVQTNPTVFPNDKTVSSIADFIQTLYIRISKFNSSNQS